MRRRRQLLASAALASLGFGGATVRAATGEPTGGRRLQVGPARALKTPAAAARIARDGDTVEIDAGDYLADVAVWTQDRLALRARGGPVRLRAAGAAAEDKAIWVVRGGSVAVEGIEFSGTRVPGRNGAGIRFERGRLTVRDCRFTDNEMGLLTSNDPSAELVVEASEFDHNQRPDGHDHNLYVGTIASVSVTGSDFHHGHIGHLLKSRAAVSRIFYNRLADGHDGSASYELEFPNGGAALVVGNLVQQSAATENPALVAYGMEGYRWPANTLTLAHNTLVDDLPSGGLFLRIAPGHGELKLAENVFTGAGSWPDAAGDLAAGGNRRLAPDDFVCAACGDYRLTAGAARRLGAVTTPEAAEARPEREFRPPRGSVALGAAARWPGAFQTTGPP